MIDRLYDLRDHDETDLDHLALPSRQRSATGGALSNGSRYRKEQP
jgi:hypothetical protein